ncbi:MAG: precorrin-2 dehydrogenase/sirohydrochlorin ferrochelatase family protein, partial [Candidatus Caldatribacteriaceae bacterium]
LVVGGGKVAWRKISSLFYCQADIVVVAPQVCREIEILAREGKILLHRREYLSQDLEGCILVFAMTNSEKINQEIAADAKKKGVLVNAAQGMFSSFFIPAVIRREDWLIAISTSGKSPFLSRKLKEWLENILPPNMEILLKEIEKLRRKWKSKNIPLTKKVELYEQYFREWKELHQINGSFFSGQTGDSWRSK